MTTEEINAMRRAALYNIKALNTGFSDYFGKDEKKERQLEIERQKLAVVLAKIAGIKNVDEVLLKPGAKRR